ncbi:unnamed protein product [Mucor hiemalis]
MIPRVVGEENVALSVFHAYAHSLRCQIMDKDVDESTFAVNLIDKFHSIFIGSRLDKCVKDLRREGQKVEYGVSGNCFKGDKQIGKKSLSKRRPMVPQSSTVNPFMSLNSRGQTKKERPWSRRT